MAAAIPFIPSIIQGGTALIGGLVGSSASKKAAAAQALGQKAVIDNTNAAVSTGQNAIGTGEANANDVLTRSAQTQLGMYAPYVGAGQDALKSLQDLASATGPLTQQFSFTPTDLQNDPGYAFTLAEGQKAIQRSAAARGGLFSGGTLKKLADYTTGSAETYFNSAFNRALQTFDTNRSTALSRIGTLQNLANVGYSGTVAGAGAVGDTSRQQAQNTFSAATNRAGLGVEGARLVNSALTGQADAKAAGTIGAANAWSGALGGVGNAAQSAGLTNFLMKRGIFGKTPAAPSTSAPIIGGAPWGGGGYSPADYDTSDYYAFGT